MNKIILMGVPHHNNLGDHAIVIAERKFINDNFNDFQYYEVSEETLENCIEKIKDHIGKDDLIFLHGGGNFGDEYIYIEEGRRKVIQMFPNNIIVLFPETIFFSNTLNGQKELNKSREIYQKHKKLILIAREKFSYEIMQKEFYNNIILKTPDIVAYLNETKDNFHREGVLFIIRNDVESKITKENIRYIEKKAGKHFKKIEYDDTAKGEGIKDNNRIHRLEKMLNRYRSSELVITDRLHGMIFAAITSTPCIALGNYNHKIKGCCKMFEHLEYIKYIEDVKETDKTIKYLLNNKFEKYDNNFAQSEFEKIIATIQKIRKEE